jgi:plasmid stabilization system protein ParE
MKLRFAPRAVRDLEAIGDYIRSKNPVAAVKVRAAILATLQMLVQFPHAGRAQSTEGVRKIVARRYPYIVYYSVDAAAQEIVVIAINHPAREREFSDL